MPSEKERTNLKGGRPEVSCISSVQAVFSHIPRLSLSKTRVRCPGHLARHTPPQETVTFRQKAPSGRARWVPTMPPKSIPAQNQHTWLGRHPPDGYWRLPCHRQGCSAPRGPSATRRSPTTASSTPRKLRRGAVSPPPGPGRRHASGPTGVFPVRGSPLAPPVDSP